jgi:hypothetical protein
MTGRIIHGDATADKFEKPYDPGQYTIKDSGARQEFSGGMVRDTEDDKIDYTSCTYGPMFKRWNAHMTKGRAKYPDREDGTPNWTLGALDPSVLDRAKRSAFRHFIAWLNGEEDEDHAAGVYFNINLVEFCKAEREQRCEKQTKADELFEVRTGADATAFTDLVKNEINRSRGLINRDYWSNVK